MVNIKSNFSDGVHIERFGKNKVEIFLRGIENCPPGKRVLVNFSGAVMNRDQKEGPFFSGLGISKKLNAPLIAFSDPSLELDQGLNLAWYAGHENFLDLQEALAKYLDKVVIDLGLSLIIFGGSGGGFAALAVASLMKQKATLFIWNPQTSILKYTKKAVDKYIDSAFPAIKGRADNNEDALYRSGIIYDVSDVFFSKNINLLYFQNDSDWHVKHHCCDFVKNRKLERKKNMPFFKNDNFLVFFGSWGEGHKAPPAFLIEKVLSELILSGDKRVLDMMVSDSEISKLFSDDVSMDSLFL